MFANVRASARRLIGYSTYCDGFSNSDNLQQRLYERKPKGNGKGVLRLVRSLTEFGISARPHVPAGIQSPGGRGGSGYDDLRACQT